MRVSASVRAAVVLFAIRARRLIEGTGKDTGKGLLRIKAVFQADIINPLVGICRSRAASSSLRSRM